MYDLEEKGSAYKLKKSKEFPICGQKKKAQSAAQ